MPVSTTRFYPLHEISSLRLRQALTRTDTLLLGTVLFFLYFAILYNLYGVFPSEDIARYRAMVDCQGDEACYNAYLAGMP
jgi:hypothetical protein